MLTEREIRRILDAVLAHSRADQTEALLFESDSALTRFANNEIHQNVAERDASLLVRVVFGKKIGVASLNRTDEAGARLVVDRACELARFQVENEDFQGLPGPHPVPPADGYAEGTAAFSPEDRARGVAVVVRRSMENGLVAAGAFSTSVGQVAISNSLGAFCHHSSTHSELSTVIMSEDSSGYAGQLAKDARDIDYETVARVAVDKALLGRNPQPLPPGEYEVVLDEHAVCDVVDFFAYLGFGAKAVQDGRSFMSGHMGERVLGENVSIWDDGSAPDTIPMPFDYEGVPRQRVDLIKDGQAAGIVYDTTTAAKDGKQSTGHALPAGSTFGAVPAHMHMATGASTKEELIASVRRGIWITRFWYTRTVHPLSITVTGMTRDGTFFIEKGEIVGPVRNLRFTQSYVEALSNTDLIGRETTLEHDFLGYNRVPAVKIAKWNFTGATEY